MEYDITFVPAGELYKFKKSRKKPKYMLRDNYYDYFVLDIYEYCYMLRITGLKAHLIINVVTKDKIYHNIIDLGEYEHFRFEKLRNPHLRYAKILVDYCDHAFIMNKLAGTNV